MFYSIRLSIFTAGAMLGCSLLCLPSALAIYGIYAYYSWVICIIISIILGYIMSILSQTIKTSGGPYIYIKSLIPKFSLLVGIMHLSALIIQLSAIYFVISQYCNFINPIFTLTIIPILNYITNCYGTEFSLNINMLLNIIKIIPILVLLIAGFINTNSFIITPVSSEYPIINSIGLIIFAFSGFEFGLIPEQNSVKNIAIPIIIGILFGAFIEISAQFLVCNLIQNPELSTTPLNDLAFQLFGNPGYIVLLITSCLFCIIAGHTSFFICGKLSEAIFNSHQESRLSRMFLLIIIIIINYIFTFGENYLGIFSILVKLSDLLLTIPLMFSVICYKILFPKQNFLFILGLISSFIFTFCVFLSLIY